MGQEQTGADRERVAVVQHLVRRRRTGAARGVRSTQHAAAATSAPHTLPIRRMPGTVAAKPGVRSRSPVTRRPGSRFNTAVSSGYVGIYSFELFFPESHSLKEKRMVCAP